MVHTAHVQMITTKMRVEPGEPVEEESDSPGETEELLEIQKHLLYPIKRF